MSELRQLTLRGATGKYRTAVHEDKDFIVVPVTALVEGVIQALNAPGPEFVPAATFNAMPAGWNGRPVMFNHPVVDGKPVSANTPRVLDTACFGKIFNTGATSTELNMEAWLDPMKAAALGEGPQKTIDRVLNGESVEVSVGAWVTAEESKGTHNGKKYVAVWRDLVPDHLAFLEEGQVGACSNEMGCGVRAAAVHTLTAEGTKPMSTEAEPKRTLRERLKNILPFKTNAKGYSDVDLRDALREVLSKEEPTFAFIEAVFESDGYLVYCNVNASSDSYEEHYFKRTFSLDKASGEATLGTERVEVEPVMHFEPTAAAEGQPRAACSCKENDTPSEKESTMNRAERIQALIANADCPIKEQVALEALSDAGLAALEEKVTAPKQQQSEPEKKQEPVAAAAKQEPKTEAQWLEEAPANVREMIARHAAQDAATKQSLIDTLKVAQKTYSEAELTEMSIPQLQKIGDLLQLEVPRTAVDFSARNPLPRAAAEQDEHVPTAWDSLLNAGKEK